MKQLLTVLLTFLLVQGVTAQTKASLQLDEGDNWKVLGTREIGFKADYDVIVLTAGNDRIRKIKFQVNGSPVDMINIEITYDVGSSDKIEMRGRIADGGESRPVDIKGIGRKKIRKITFWYDTKGFSGKATVTILGVE